MNYTNKNIDMIMNDYCGYAITQLIIKRFNNDGIDKKQQR